MLRGKRETERERQRESESAHQIYCCTATVRMFESWKLQQVDGSGNVSLATFVHHVVHHPALNNLEERRSEHLTCT